MSDADFNEKPRLRSRQWLEQERRAVALDGNSKPVSHQSAPKFPGARGSRDHPEQAQGQLSNKAKKREAVRETLKAKRDSKKGDKPTKLSAAERKEQEQQRTNSASEALVAKCFDPTTRKLLVDRSLRIVADTASKVTAEPEKELAPLFPFFLKLHAKLDRAEGDHLQSVKHCALISAVAVLRDILPGYKLRAEGVPDKSQTLLSRHVLRTQKFEQLLLQQYEKVVNVLLMSVKQNPVIYAVPLCSLATRGKAMSFNFRNRLVAALVKLANRKVLQDDLDEKSEEWRLIVHPACEALRDVIEQDRGLEVCKEVVTAVGLLAKRAATASRGSAGGHNTNSMGNKPGGAGINDAAAGKTKAGEGGEQPAHDSKNPSNVPSCAHLLSPHLLSTLLSLKLDRSRELTEEDNDDAELDREMLESSFATKKKHDLQKVETEILGETIVIYLRVLRVHFLFSPAVLRAALSGLAKFATLVNVELLLEILQEVQGVLKLALSKMDAESASLSLSAVVKLLASPAGRNLALGDDLNWVATSVFEALPLFLLCEERIRPEILHCVNLCISECPQVFSKANLSSCALLCEGLVRDLAANVGDGSAEVLRPQRYDQTQRGTCMKETAKSAAGGAEFLQEASKLLQKHQRLNSVLTSEGGLYGVLAETGITERPIQLFYTLTTLSKHSDAKVARLASFLLQQQGKLLQLPQWAVGTAAGENALKRGRTASGMKEESCPSVLDGVELPKRQKTLGKKAFLPTEKLGN